VYRISKRVNGRGHHQNYDPTSLRTRSVSFFMRRRTTSANDVVIDIRPGFPGGEHADPGRSGSGASRDLTFLGVDGGGASSTSRPILTPALTENRAVALRHRRVAQRSRDAGRSPVRFNGPILGEVQAGYQWKTEAFSMLYQLSDERFRVAPAGRRSRSRNRRYRDDRSRAR